MAAPAGGPRPGSADEWITHGLTVHPEGRGEIDLNTLPDRPGVAVFVALDGRALLIATTASLRGLAARKLGAHGPADGGERVAPRADLRAITARVLAVATQSGFESDLVYLAQARERLPEVYRVVAERWRSWWVSIDPAAEHPEWTKTNLTEMGRAGVRARSAARPGRGPAAAHGVLLGPFPDKDAAGRYIELVIDAYDLCRYHHLLVLSPGATACPYKEMGRCPAPCDGSEPLGAYRARVAAATAALGRGASVAAEVARTAMTGAGAAGAFEQAAGLKRTAERVAQLKTAAFRSARSLERFRWVVVQPHAGDRGRARGFGFIGGRLLRLGDVDLRDEPAAARRLAAWTRTVSDELCILHGTPEETDTLGVASRWLFKPAARRRGVWIDVGMGAPAAEGDRAWVNLVRDLKKDRGADVAAREEELSG